MPISQKSPPAKIGFFGGSFDPVHIGHLSIARQAIEGANLDLLIFCPAYHAPLRKKQPLLPARLRFDMLKVITAENDRMEVSSLELDKQKTCYTYHTVQEIQKQYPTSKIMLILGSDQFNRLSEWKFSKELAKLCHFLVFSRTTTHISSPLIPDLSYQHIKNNLINCSSTEIRNRIRNNKPVDKMIPNSILNIFLQFLSR
jgi:nicotinate-nucleotide adenylyltransferase